MNNICLSLSLNYPPDFLNPFIKSFEKYASGILFIITDIPEQIKQSKKIIPLNVNDLIAKYNITTKITAFNLKPIIFYLFLKEQMNVNNVLISDVDVIFQDDPFSKKELPENNLFVCEEKKIFKNCEVNQTWLKISYPQFLSELYDKQILNSGVVYGEKTTMQNYFKEMAYEMQNILPKCNYPILDQIILNILFYIKKTIKPTLLSHNNGFIAHLSQVDKSEIDSNNITNDDIFLLNGIKNTIVHQYNKHPTLNNFYTNLYGK